ncbi:Zinc/iron permease [Dissoconium aciculare CBS 342.82]|uniref:Zinc/iron permease n=1 Tax=Dissoconium aciculare CBS 342.82 TaxID=1314786 RepID=A0A6J3MAH9_9PEZI|nr:Zinc/iron permease [Dissoconium aciculare CBS 342.82]KAF1824639.1 Zinc/iron permease [Dissoconium aciculare CBS 342.82]
MELAGLSPSASSSLVTRWAEIPTSYLLAELARRQENRERPACGSGKTKYPYNTSVHVGALFLILFLSTLACSFPVIVRRFPRLPVPNHAIFISRHFGTGVLIATAFVHLLPTAFVSLTDPCLPPFWNKTYPAMAGFISMISVLFVVGVEMFFAIKGAVHSHNEDEDGSISGDVEESEEGERVRATSIDKPLPLLPKSGDGDNDSDLDLDELDPITDDMQPLTGRSASRGGESSENGHQRPKNKSRQVSFAESPSYHEAEPDASANEKRMILQCLLLEAGILFHSVFIGMALSVSTGPAFAVLLLAISFHQTFEGLALGTRIAAIKSFSTSSTKPWLMSLMYGITTPIGQAIGLAVHTLYDPASEFGLLMVGIVNGISSGLLLYAGLVQLIAEDFLSDHSYVELQGRRRVQACLAVVAGGLLMALVGAFA